MLLVFGGLIGLGVAPADGVTFSLRRAAILTSEPSYAARYRLELDSSEVLVEGPALEQKGTFCRYRLIDLDGKPLQPKIAWTPCYSIDKVILSP